MSCPFYMLYLSASANEESRKTRTNSTNEEVLERREKYFEARKQTIDIDVPYLKHIFYDVQQERCPYSGIKIDINDIKIINKQNENWTDWRWCLAPSLDRLDNEPSYIKGNIAIVTRFVNLGFRDFEGDRDIVAGILFRGEPRPLEGLENCLV